MNTEQPKKDTKKLRVSLIALWLIESVQAGDLQTFSNSEIIKLFVKDCRQAVEEVMSQKDDNT